MIRVIKEVKESGPNYAKYFAIMLKTMEKLSKKDFLDFIEELNMTPEGEAKLKEAIKSSDIFILDDENPDDYEEATDYDDEVSYFDIFPLVTSNKFYGDDVETIENNYKEGTGSVIFLLRTVFGNMLQIDTGVMHMIMDGKTKNNFIKFVKENPDKVNKMCSDYID